MSLDPVYYDKLFLYQIPCEKLFLDSGPCKELFLDPTPCAQLFPEPARCKKLLINHHFMRNKNSFNIIETLDRLNGLLKDHEKKEPQ